MLDEIDILQSAIQIVSKPPKLPIIQHVLLLNCLLKIMSTVPTASLQPVLSFAITARDTYRTAGQHRSRWATYSYNQSAWLIYTIPSLTSGVNCKFGDTFFTKTIHPMLDSWGTASLVLHNGFASSRTFSCSCKTHSLRTVECCKAKPRTCDLLRGAGRREPGTVLQCYPLNTGLFAPCRWRTAADRRSFLPHWRHFLFRVAGSKAYGAHQRLFCYNELYTDKSTFYLLLRGTTAWPRYSTAMSPH